VSDILTDEDFVIIRLRESATGIMASSGLTVLQIDRSPDSDDLIIFTMSNGGRVTTKLSEDKDNYLLRVLESGNIFRIPKEVLGKPC